MIGTDYMNDPTIHDIFPCKKEKWEIDIELLNECIDDILDEVMYSTGNMKLVNKLAEHVYTVREKMNTIA